MNRILLIVFILANSGGCRFVVPGSSETSALQSKGVFSGGAPAWAKLPNNANTTLPGKSGFMPITHTVPEGVSMSANSNASSAVRPELGRGLEEKNKEVVDKSYNSSSKKAVSSASSQDEAIMSSPVKQIEKECPGSTKEVLDAVGTVSLQERIRKYLSLTRQCPSSAQLWVWLAKDYSSARRYSDARRCVQAALAIDPDNEEAKVVYKELTSAPGASTIRVP